MKDEYGEQVIEELADHFGEIDTNTIPFHQFEAIVENVVNDNYSDYFRQLLNVREDSFLEELDEFNVEVEFKSALKNSIFFAVAYRMGYEVDNYFTSEDFK